MLVLPCRRPNRSVLIIVGLQELTIKFQRWEPKSARLPIQTAYETAPCRPFPMQVMRQCVGALGACCVRCCMSSTPGTGGASDYPLSDQRPRTCWRAYEGVLTTGLPGWAGGGPMSALATSAHPAAPM